jgi:hypothetical protein
MNYFVKERLLKIYNNPRILSQYSFIILLFELENQDDFFNDKCKTEFRNIYNRKYNDDMSEGDSHNTLAKFLANFLYSFGFKHQDYEGDEYALTIIDTLIYSNFYTIESILSLTREECIDTFDEITGTELYKNINGFYNNIDLAKLMINSTFVTFSYNDIKSVLKLVQTDIFNNLKERIKDYLNWSDKKIDKFINQVNMFNTEFLQNIEDVDIAFTINETEYYL